MTNLLDPLGYREMQAQPTGVAMDMLVKRAWCSRCGHARTPYRMKARSAEGLPIERTGFRECPCPPLVQEWP